MRYQLKSARTSSRVPPKSLTLVFHIGFLMIRTSLRTLETSSTKAEFEESPQHLDNEQCAKDSCSRHCVQERDKLAQENNKVIKYLTSKFISLLLVVRPLCYLSYSFQLVFNDKELQ